MRDTQTAINFLKIVFLLAFILITVGCGTTVSIKQPFVSALSKKNTSGKQLYSMGSCESFDKDASIYFCNDVRDRVQYGLFKNDIYSSGDNATREVNLSITYLRRVNFFARFCLFFLPNAILVYTLHGN